MSVSTHAVKCARCKCVLETLPDAKPEPRAACPQCGEGDTLENVRREVGEYIQEHISKTIHGALVDGVRGSKNLKVTSDFHPKGGHRFIVDLEPR